MKPDGTWESDSLPTPGQVERAKPILRDALAAGRDDIWIGLTRWRYKPFPPPAKNASMSCGHPYAARKVSLVADGTIGTTCWACEVEQEIK